MLNLMKYEFLKQRSSKLILGGFLLIAEIAFILGMITQRDSIMGLSVTALFVITSIGFFMVGLEAIFTYYTDMKEKRGYMLFMTPHSVYTIMASKILTSIITIVIWTLLIGLLAFIDLAILAAVYSDMADVLEVMRLAIRSLYDIEISWSAVAMIAGQAIMAWIGTVTSAFLAITISTTLLSGRRHSGIISFILYVLLNMIPGRIYILLCSLFGIIDNGSRDGVNLVYEMSEHAGASASLTIDGFGATGLLFAVTCVFAVLCFMCSGTILQKRLSL